MLTRERTDRDPRHERQMVRLRWAFAPMLIVMLLAVAGCGQLKGSQSLPRDGLDVLLAAVSVRQGEGITVEALPVGILRTGEWLHSVVLVKADDEVSTRSLAYFDGLAQRDGGGAELGLTGLCGQGWTKDGDQIQTERCAAATPVAQISAGKESLVHLGLHPVTPSGPVTTGTYRITIPFNDPDGPFLDLTYRVVKRGQAELPQWSAERIPLALSFENEPAEAWSSLLVRIKRVQSRLPDRCPRLSGMEDLRSNGPRRRSAKAMCLITQNECDGQTRRMFWVFERV